MVMGDKGTMFMGTRVIGRVYAITDNGGKREAKVIIQGLTQPNGLAFKDGSLYVFAINKVFRYDKIEDNLDKLPEPVELTKTMICRTPSTTIGNTWRSGRTARCTCRSARTATSAKPTPASMARSAATTPTAPAWRSWRAAVRNTVGFDWHPVTKELWFTDNGRDWAGNAGPEDELNRIPKNMEGASFGFPYCHANGIPDPDIKRPNPCAGVIMPAALTGPHSAGPRHQVLHRRHVPEAVQERRVHRAARLLEPRAEVRV
jgi:glucose/arabinose dehydrogenase